ncbi:class I adenylate-forming enzyme family protein [Aeromicrobium sp. 9AM]|uniref:class I adenylate-forming enzyme family protein n=1 Tax=Aeromicrobium sp. 9AM TaxID=2653126 RepID=UPI0012F24D0B|nr:class I adenylate-forming enzyme family protein [Aeromicrobium sp. 9AM]VXB47663.1 AMP-binding enzyme [Aeromicrobium sp. 9AM]
MIELLAAAAAHDASAPAISYASRESTYGDLLLAARRTAANLRRAGIERFAIRDPDPHTLVALLGGASLAGVEACIYPPTASPEMVADLAERFDHDVVVSPEPFAGDYSVLDPSKLVAAGEPLEDGAAAPARQPHLVLTTGTTGAPRAVRHDWSRLLARRSDIQATQERWLLGYSLNQFGGLQVLIHTMSSAALLVVAPSFQPADGLAAMRDQAVTHASATPTFWRFVLAEMAADGRGAPSLRQITLGGEAIPSRLLGDLAQAFPDAKITQIYAASEFGAISSVKDRENGLPISVLESKTGVELKVVDGELWARTGTGMLGYYGEPDLEDGSWRATGDLVDVNEGRLHFRGRISEVINVGGVKVHPLPVEERIDTVPGVSALRVFGRASSVAGAIVAVEVVAAPGVDLDELNAAIRTACEDLPPAYRPRSIRFVPEISTIGSKTVRRDLSQENQHG